MFKAIVSNFELPTQAVGSWTNRLTIFIKNNPYYFTHILSPSKATAKNIYCNKRRFLTWRLELRNLVLRHWVAKDFIYGLKKCIHRNENWLIVIMDDLHLLEAIIWANKHYNWQAKIVLSFHGFDLKLNSDLCLGTHNILFLSKLAQRQFLNTHINYKNNTAVVGNAVESKAFFPLSANEKKLLRKKLGYLKDDIILIWMAKDRPKKGFDTFKHLVKRLWATHPQLKVITIGTNQIINNSNVLQLGIIPNEALAKYLQISNIYTFTTQYQEGFGLSMIEAYKCGNTVVASNVGAIPEVLNGLPNTILIDNYMSIDAWFECCSALIKDLKSGKTTIENEMNIWDYQQWEYKFKQAISNLL